MVSPGPLRQTHHYIELSFIILGVAAPVSIQLPSGCHQLHAWCLNQLCLMLMVCEIPPHILGFASTC